MMLSDKVCLVAGGGRGIGRAAALELGRHGASVVVNDLGADVQGSGSDERPAQAVADKVETAGGTAMAHFGDVTDLEYTETLVADVVEEYGRLDGVVNFAGILSDAICYEMTGEQWDQVIDVHLRGHFSLLRNAAAHWRETAEEDEAERSFLAVTSRSALGSVGQLNYSTAKAGVLGLTRTAARELARYDVRVNALMPTAYTRMVEGVPEEHLSFGEDEMAPEDVAPAVAYLLSDEAESVTGTTVRAAGDSIGVVSDPEVVRLGVRDGGWTAGDIAERFESDVANGLDLERTGPAF